MLIRYSDLSAKDKEKMNCLLNKEYNESEISSLEERYKDDIYRRGNDIFVYLDSTSVFIFETILKEVEILKTGYIILGNTVNLKEKEFIEALDYVKEEVFNEGALEILFAYRESEDFLNLVGINYEYRSLRMELEDQSIRDIELLSLEELKEDNLERFIYIYNLGFNHMVHGVTLSIEEGRIYLKEKERNYIVKYNSEDIGFLTLDIDGDTGSFDIGLDKRFRGKGFGKSLLETAIVTLKSRGIKNIQLTVIEKNKLALKLYKDRGFKINKVLGKWCVLDSVKVGILTEEEARETCKWKYNDEYAVYNMSYKEAVKYNYAIANDKKRENEFISFRVNNNLIAYGRIRKEKDEIYLGIGIKPELCGKGFGKIIMKLLIDESIERYRGYSIVLEVREFNKRAIKCYEKLGFKVVEFYEIVREKVSVFYKMKYFDGGIS